MCEEKGRLSEKERGSQGERNCEYCVSVYEVLWKWRVLATRVSAQARVQKF